MILLENDKLRKRIKKNSYKIVTERFSISKTVENFEKLIKNLINHTYRSNYNESLIDILLDILYFYIRLVLKFVYAIFSLKTTVT